MKKVFLWALLPFAFYACTKKTDQRNDAETTEVSADTTEEITPTLTKVWETDTVMTTAESTLYGADNDIIYVINIDGNHSVNDGNGFISIMLPDGTIIRLQWVTGLNAPQRMAILND